MSENTDWIPQIEKVENGYIVILTNDKNKIKEVYVYHGWEDVVLFLTGHFQEDIKEFLQTIKEKK